MAKNNEVPFYLRRQEGVNIPSIIDLNEAQRERVKQSAPSDVQKLIELGEIIRRRRDAAEREEKRKLQRKKEYEERERERKRQEEEELDRQLRQQKEEEKLELERKEKEADEAYEKSYQQWITDKTDFLGPLQDAAKSVISNIPQLNLLSRTIYGSKNAVGNFVVNQLVGNALSQEGRIALNDNKIDGAKAHLRIIDLQQLISSLEQERDNLVKQEKLDDLNYVAANQNTLRYQSALQAYNKYNTEIQSLYGELQDPLLNEKDKYYKAAYVADNMNAGDFINTLGGAVMDKLRGITVNSFLSNRPVDPQTARLREDIARERFEKTAARYDAKIQSTKRDANGVILNNTPIGDKDYDYNQTQKNINQWEKENETYAERRADDIKWQDTIRNTFGIAKAYENASEVYQNSDLWDFGFWFYGMPGTMGMSFSSPDQAVATGLQAAGVAATVATGNPLWMNTGTLSSGYFLLEAGRAENYGEVGEKRADNIYQQLQQIPNEKKKDALINDMASIASRYWKEQGLDQDWITKRLDINSEQGVKNIINDALSAKAANNGNWSITDPELRKMQITSTAGLLALFEADNTRTISELPFQLAFEVWGGPLDKMIKKSYGFVFDKLDNAFANRAAGRFVREGTENLTSDGTKNVAGETLELAERAARGKYKNGFRRKSQTTAEAFRKGWQRGSTAGEMGGFGYFGGIAGGTVGGVANATAHLVRETLPKNMKIGLDKFEQAVANKYMNIYDKILADRLWIALAGKYGYQAGKNILADAASEMAEEGVQYLNSKEDFAKKYGYGGVSFGDLIMNDMAQGVEIMKAYGSLLGLSDSELKDDAEFWPQLKSAFAMSVLGMGTVTNVTGAVNDINQQLDGDKFVAANFAMSREADKINRASNVGYAKAAMEGKSDGVRNALKTRMQHDMMREAPEYTQEMYDEQINDFEAVTKLANNQTIRAKLEAKGIKYGTDQFANAIADIANLRKQAAENSKALLKNNNDLNSVYYSKAFNDEVEEVSDDILSQLDSLQNDKIKEAGDKAVAEYLLTQKDLERDVNSSESKQRIREIRESAEEAERENIKNTVNTNVRNITRAVNKLHGLLKLKSKVSTMDDWYKTLSEKFGIKTLRPDSKLIVKDIERQIKQQKEFLKDLYENFNTELSDAETIKYINGLLEVIRTNSDQAEELEIVNALIGANSAVVANYLNQFEEGLVVNKDGKYEYNPAQYKVQKDRLRRMRDAMMAGDLEQIEAIRKEDSYEEYDLKKVADNPYAKRIDAIIETNKRNEALDWMVEDIASGDAVVKAYEAYEEDKNKQPVENKEKTSEDPFDSEIKPENKKQNKKKQDRLIKNKLKYQRRIAKARDSYNKRKAKYKNWKHGSLNATFLPFQDALVKAANALWFLLEDGVYTIARFVEDMQMIVQDKDVSEMISDLKRLYIGKYAQLQYQGSPLVNNMSTPAEVAAYVPNTDVNTRKAYQPPTVQLTPVTKGFKNWLTTSRENVVPEISGYFDTIVKNGNSVDVYQNKAAVQILSEEAKGRLNEITSHLRSLSGESLRTNLSQYFPESTVAVYMQYSSNKDVIDAAARAIYNAQLDKDSKDRILIGKTIRDNVVKIFNGDLSNLVKIGFSDNQWNEFVNRVLQIKLQIEARGFTILDVMLPIYGTDKDGNKLSSEADIILVNESGDILIIDVTYGYMSVYARLSNPRTTRVHLDQIYQNEVDILNQILDIIENTYPANIKGTYVWPFLYNYRDHEFKSEDIIRVSEEQIDKSQLEQNVEKANKLVENINGLIDDYNSLAIRLNKGQKDHISPYAFSTQAEFDEYFEQLGNLYESLSEEVRDLDREYQAIRNAEDDVVFEILSLNTPPDDFLLSFTIEELHRDLEDSVAALDDSLLSFPIGRITNQNERQNMIYIYGALFRAQNALNEFLAHPDAGRYDVSSECEMIASALEKIHMNKAYLGRDAIFVLNWWLSKFTLEDGTTHDVSAYFNAIRNWLNTLSGYVNEDDNFFDLHPQLARWYSSVLNTHFSKLIGLAEKLITPANEAVYGIAIRRAKQLISDFNINWGVEPDRTYDNPPETMLEYISRMPLRWKDLYGVSESHSPAIDQMANAQRPYYYFSQLPDFLSKSRITFGLNKNGEVQVRILYGDGPNAPFANFTFNNSNEAYGENLTPEIESRNRVLNRGNRKFTAKLKAMIEYRMAHPEYEIEVDAHVNKGSIHYSRNKNAANSVVDVIFSDPYNQIDLYNVTVSELNHIGVLSTIYDFSGNVIDYKVKTGPNLKSDAADKFDSEFKKRNLNTSSGMLVYFFDYGDGKRIGIPMRGTTIGENTANKLVDLILKASVGINEEDGYNILSLLQQRLFIKFGDLANRSSSFNNVKSLITVTGENTILINGKTYNLNTQRQDVIDIISKTPNVIPGFLLSDRIANVVPKVVDKFRDNSSLQQVTLPNGFVITREDISKNSTWLGYFFRNNVVATRAEIKKDPKYPEKSSIRGYRQINFSNPRLVLKRKPNVIEHKLQDVQTTDQAKNNPNNIFGKALHRKNGSLHMMVTKDQMVQRTDEEQKQFVDEVREFFTRVFGTSEDVVFTKSIEDALKLAGEDEVIAGECTSQLILICTSSPFSAAYHEAFHKIIELILSDSERNAIYDAYRSHNGEKLSERAVAEGLADMFVDYMSNKREYKNAKWYKKPVLLFKKVGILASLVNMLGYRQAKAMFRIYGETNRGEIKKREGSTLGKRERFRTVFNDHLYKTITSRGDVKYTADFKYLLNSTDVYEMCKSLGYLLATRLGFDDLLGIEKRKTIDQTSLKLIDDLTRRALCHLDDNDQPLPIPEGLEHRINAWREVFESKKEIRYDKNNKPYYETVYPKFAALHTMVGDYLATVAGDYRGKYQLAEEEEDEDEKVQRNNIDKYDKASIEFNKLDGVTDRVKLFFGTIPYITPEGDYDYSKSQFGTPTFMPLEEVYNVIVNDLYNVRSIEQLRYEIEKRAAYDPTYMMVNEKFQDLYELAYYTDDQGNAQIDYDAESMLISILMAIRSQKHDFKIARTRKDKSGNKTTSIITSSTDRDTKIISRQWQLMLISGQVGVFQHGTSTDESLLFRQETDPKIFDNLVDFFNNVITDLSQNANTYSADNAVLLRKDIVKRLNQIGILISDNALKHMLVNKYQGVGADSIYKWLTTTSKETSILPFIASLKQFAPNGKINTHFINRVGYSTTSFVTNLANAEGAYRRITTLQMAYGLDGKTLYTISQNSSISKICDDLNTGNINEPLVKLLSEFNYNLYNDGLSKQGSLILKRIADGNPVNLKLFTFIGAKTDNKGDRGSKYLDLAKADDYIAKLTMLQNGDIIMPALADKGTYQGMEIFGKDGQKINLIPGIQFTEAKDADGNTIMTAQNTPKIAFMGNHVYLRPCDAVLRQMIEYAVTEKVAIEKCIEDLKTLKDDEKIKNYHTKNKNGVEPNGTRFLLFTEIVVETSKGKFETINLNDPNESSLKMLERANHYFFSKSVEDLMTIMAQTLAMHTVYEVQEAERLGLITRSDTVVHNLILSADGKTSRKEILSDDSTNKNSIINIETDLLNELQINLIMLLLMQTMPESWKKLNSPRTIDLYNERIKIVRSAAIAAILQDATLRSIISAQEVLRCFCGHPGMFKVEYDKVNKRIKDSTFDLQKRIGGMISTGDDNVTDLPQIKKQYVCAEIKDYEVASSSDIAPRLLEMFESGMLVDLYNRYSYKKDWKVDAEDIKNLKAIPDRFSHSEEAKAKWAELVNKTIEIAYVHSSSYQAGINVADGAAYITALMCKDMLRMNGRLDEKAKLALDILMNPNTQYSWLKSALAYKDIYDAINITPTKYTAYGFREHTTNGSQSTKVAVPYYNKFALFPIFPCMTSGNMKAIYDKMLNEGVDMALMDSAVKVGSQGAVKYNGTSIDEPFTKYVQEFSFIRKQQNTDPEEGSKTTVGSQVVKVCLQSLILDKPYKNFEDGKEILGKDIYDQFMKSIQEISESGVLEILDEFMEDLTEEERENGNPRRISVEKLSKYLNDQLSSRNASNTIMEAIQTHNSSTGLLFNAPLAATPDATWIESIIISHINKKVIDINAPGSSFIQRSVFAIEGGGNPHLTINDGKKLLMINESGSMDCILSMDYFTDILFVNKMGDKSFEELRQWLIDHHIIGNTSDTIANTIGYRVPTQAQSSIHALRCVDVLPACKNTIILPEEFTRITGSDFDIDHFYLWSFDYNVEDDKDGSQNISIKENPTNTLLKCILTILTNVDNSIQYLYKPVDSDTKLVKDIADEILETNSLNYHAFNFGTLHEQIERKNDYVTGKVGIGPFALNVTNQELTRLSGVKFADSIITRSTNIGSLDNTVDTDDNPISSWESGFINSHVDIVKDPYISKLNVNQFTYNLCNLLTRSGFGETTLWFLCQPIIRRMAEASNAAGSQYIRKGNKGIYTIREEAITKAAMEVLNIKDVATFSMIMDRINNPKDKRDYQYMANSILWILKNKELLRRIAIEYSRNPNIKNIMIDNVEYSVKNVQMQVLVAYKSLNSYERGLSKLVQYTKIDTRKHGKNLILIRRYLRNYMDLISKADAEKSVFDKKSLHNLVDNTWIDYKTKNAIQLPFLILGGLTYNANELFINQILEFADILNILNDDIGERLMVDLSRATITAIKVNYIVNYAKTYQDGQAIKQKTDIDIAKLFTSSNALSKRLNRLLDQVRNNPKYQRLENNYLLLSISAEFEEDPIVVDGTSISKPSFITLSSTVTDNKNNGEIFSEAWEDLLEDEDPFVRNFANDLIIYAFITSGEYSGWNKLLKYVPYNWIVGKTRGFDHRVESFAAYTQRMLAGDMIGLLRGLMLDDIVGNNFMNSSIIHMSSIVDPEDNSINFVRNNKGTMVIGKSVNDQEDAPQYISLQKPGTRGKYQADFDIFKLTGFYGMYPIYAQIQKRGYHRDNGHDIYEYGWDFNYIENKSKPMAIVYEDDIQEAILILQDQSIVDDMSVIIGKITLETNDVVRRRKASRLSIRSTDDIMFDDETMLNIYQSWEYMEDSGDSTPKGDIKSLKFIAKRMLGEEIDSSIGNRMYDFVLSAFNIANRNSDKSIDVPYSEYKGVISNINRFDSIREMLVDEWGYDPKNDVYGKYDNSNKTISLNESVYDLYKLISQNQDLLEIINDIKNKWTRYIVTDEDSLLDIISEGVDLFDEVEKQTENYSELDLFQDTVLDGILVQNVSNVLSTKDKIPSFYVGMITPDENTIFVFGSNPKGIHGAGAAKTAKTQFGAIQGQGEGMQGNVYALPTKDLNKARGTRWYRPGKKEEAEVKEWYKDHDYSEVQNHPLNAERTMSPQQIIESIKKLYEVAAQNPNKQFKVSHYPFGQLSLNGYLGEEMLAMFKQAGPIPSNVVFNKEWTDHWNDMQSDGTHETEEFYTKLSMLDYVQDRVADGIPREDIKVTHYEETEDTDEYWVVEVKFSQDYKNSADHNGC